MQKNFKNIGTLKIKIMNTFLLNERLIEQIEKNKNTEIEFRIGVSKFDKEQLCYCLVRAINKTNIEVLLLKTMNNEQDFDLEVLHLQKIFDALVVEEK
jgi:hypothetical protein